MSEFKNGDRVYDIDGNGYNYVSKYQEKQHLCVPVYEDIEGNEFEGEKVCILRNIYAEAIIPVQKTKNELKELNKKIEEARKELNEIKLLNHIEESEIIERKNRITKHEKLKLLDDYLAGKITHFVVEDYDGVKVVDYNSFMVTDDRYEKGVKLISLFGNSKGDLEYKVNEYKDGSGTWKTIKHITTNKEDAEKCAKEVVMDKFNNYLKGEKSIHYLLSVIRQADNFGVEIPEKYRNEVKEYKTKEAKKRMEEILKEYEKAKENYEAINSGKE